MGYFSGLRSGGRDHVLAELRAYHEENPGVTEATLGGFTTRDGKTGYDLLVDHVPVDARVVLDLGCGNGPLLARLGARGVPRIVGIDVCTADLALARERGEFELHAIEGQRFAEVVEGPVDVVLSHHAFYLMEPIEPVIAQIRSVLRPGGTFAWVAWSQEPIQPFASMMARFGEISREDAPAFRGWGDPRMWSDDGLAALFAGGFSPLVRHPFVLGIAEPTETLVDRLLRFFYTAELQSPAARDQTRRAWTEILKPTERDGIAHLEFPSAILTAQRT